MVFLKKPKANWFYYGKFDLFSALCDLVCMKSVKDYT